MNARTLIRYLSGNAEAIKEVAASKSALWWSLTLVFITAIPRNYDQTFILEKPFLWVFGPVMFSTISSLFIFTFIFFDLIRAKRPSDEPKPRFWPQYRSFLGLYWMTAPIAWLYALPVERFLATEAAAWVNVSLLASVSLWRVALLSRALFVTLDESFLVILVHVLTPVCLEVVGLVFFGGPFAKMLMASMGGMRNSPEETIMLGALGCAFWISLAGLGVSAVYLLMNRSFGPVDALPAPRPSKTSWRLPVLAAIACLAIAVIPQMELARNYQVHHLLQAGDYQGALRFLSNHRRHDFAPAKRIEPDPYEGRAWAQLPKLIEAMDGHEASWLRETYLGHAGILLGHYRPPPFNEARYTPLFKAMERLPEWNRWTKTNQDRLERMLTFADQKTDNREEAAALKELEEILERAGLKSLNAAGPK